MKNLRFLIASLVCVAVLFAQATDAAKPGGGGGGTTTTTYRVVPLSATEGLVHSMNQSGEMVGELFGASLGAHYWQIGANDTVSAIPLDSIVDNGSGPATMDSVAYGINNQGLIVGVMGDYSSNSVKPG